MIQIYIDELWGGANYMQFDCQRNETHVHLYGHT